MAAGMRSLRTDLRYLLVLHIHRHGLVTVSRARHHGGRQWI
ncbi:hypothetical protein MA5S0921_0457 [Mycobacteroides abscessus 5S-0921]|nr:hypothetical protein MA5S0421_5188 [Mycobacteroides abscessus 5S-0421]EIU34181.1 hypothetical protein MA5S0708_0266 [Mycobacteroides abscessus 5S-0708]EIU49965.1 hypothetical protein MA5S1215_0269 [Mycobacteroides abscessus 5S-1215]EIV01400.1 hypothetical protein MA5S0921_0457 [Mycobacteroides abscessus 5S-0921]